MFHIFRRVQKSKTVFGLCLLLSLCFLLNACKEEKLAKYVFLFIGDGASYAQRRLTELAQRDRLFINTLPIQGASTAAALHSNLADTAASAAALASGKLGQENMVAMLSEDEPVLPLITSVAAQNGYAVGLVSDVSLDSVVPASFYAHSAKKQSYYDIAVQAKDSQISLMMGQTFKRQKAFKKEDLGVILKKSGYKQISSLKEQENLPAGKVIASFKKIPFAIDAKPKSPSLAFFVEKAINQLQNEKGFLLIAVAGKMNQAAEMHDTATMIREINAFDQAVKKAYEFYEQHPQETLIVVAGTVETGGMTLGIDNSADLDTEIFKNQKISTEAFKSAINRFRKRRPVGATVENFMPQIEKNFGLKILSKNQKADLKKLAANGDEKAKEDLKMNLDSSELALLREAFRYSMTEPSKRPKNEAYLNKYEKYDPLQIAVSAILAKRAGVGYSTFGQTAVPMPVSAVGNGAFLFMGNYPQTALFSKILGAMGLMMPVEKPENPDRINSSPAVSADTSETGAAQSESLPKNP